MQRIAVFCGSKPGNDQSYSTAAQALAKAFIKSNLGLVYGGSKVGLMGILANTVLDAGGNVFGVMPISLAEVELAHEHLTALHIVKDMQERKNLMADLADGVILLPGGMGSLDEFFEMMTLAQLGYHKKPLAVLNTNGYYDHLLSFLDHAVVQGFISQNHREMILVDGNPEQLVDKIQLFKPDIKPRY